MNKLQFLVTGTGRCGTVYMARLLTSLGIPCGHESIFSFSGWRIASQILKGKGRPQLSYVSTHNVLTNRRLPKWVDVEDIVAEASYMVAPFLNHDLLRDIPLVHIVRHPQKVISSFVKDFRYFIKRGSGWQDFIYTHVPELDDWDTQIERACCFYVRWNEIIEKTYSARRHLFHQVEEMPSAEFLDFIGVQTRVDIFDNTLVNSKRRQRTDLDIDSIPEGKVKDQFVAMILRYGYEPLSQPKLL